MVKSVYSGVDVLKFVVSLLPLSVLLYLFPHRPALSLSVGLGFAVLISQSVPPRLSVLRALAWAVSAALWVFC